MREDQEPEADRHLDGQRLLPPFQPEPEGEAVEVLEGGRVRPDLRHGLGKAGLEAPQRVRPERPAAPENKQRIHASRSTWKDRRGESNSNLKNSVREKRHIFSAPHFQARTSTCEEQVT